MQESSDLTVMIAGLKEKVRLFCSQRDWDQFHNPKELAFGISTEANELLDIFSFKSEKQVSDLLLSPGKRKEILRLAWLPAEEKGEERAIKVLKNSLPKRRR